MKALIAGLIAIVIIGGGYLVFHKSPSKTPAANSSTSQPPSSNSATDQSSNPPAASSAATITFDGSQFSPATLTVRSGSTVTIKNASSQDLQMDSNPHPIHTDDTDLNVGLVSAGQSKTFTATKTGSFGYHDHLDPGIMGQITIN